MPRTRIEREESNRREMNAEACALEAQDVYEWLWSRVAVLKHLLLRLVVDLFSVMYVIVAS